jgi:hypothetical protein
MMRTRTASPSRNRRAWFSAALSLLALALCLASGSAADPVETPAWEKPRPIESFDRLLAHSPFSLPTAEESSPLSERYAITGVVTIGGEDQVFVFDRNDQSRELVTSKPNSKNMSLVAVIREAKTPQTASIRVGGETGTIGFMESSAPKGGPTGPGQPGPMPMPMAPMPQQPPQAFQLPNLPPVPQQPGQGGWNNRRIIRRPVVTAPRPNAPNTP